ncbi:hypothetical protein GN316_00780 [Xylophilus sp. Kf1]|nr:hypothetical protein [Xylophilus sp. Kf1]
MFKRLAVVLMLVLLHLQWGLAQAHDSAEEIQGMVLAATPPSNGAPAAFEVDGPTHSPNSQEPGGVCQFHDLAHTLALAVVAHGWGGGGSQPGGARWGELHRPLAAGLPNPIDRPRWQHHASAVVAL